MPPGSSRFPARSTESPAGPGGASETNGWRFPLLLALGGLVMRVLVRLAAGDQRSDDAYIFFRYARNAVHGHGIVYNAGEHVYGFTSPLYTLLLTPLAFLTGKRGLATGAVVIGFGCWVGLALVGGRLAQRTMALPSVAATALALHFALVLGALNGMETSLFLMLLFATIYLLATDRLNAGLVIAALLALTRPEGLVVALLAALLICAWRRSKFPWPGVLASLALLGTWTLYARLTYGTFLPQSLLAKSGAVEGAAGIGGALQTLATLAFGLSTTQVKHLGAGVAVVELAAVVLLVPLVLDIAQLVRRRSLEVILPAFFVCIWVGYVVAKPVHIWSWYTAPTAAAFTWSMARQLGHHVARRPLPWVRVERRELAVGSVAALVGLAALAGATTLRTDNVRAVVGNLNRATNTITAINPHPRSVMLGDIGLLGYRLDHTRIIDLSGLVTTRPAEHRRPGQLVSLGELVREERPSAVVLTENPLHRKQTSTGSLRRPSFDNAAQRRWFSDHYRLVQRPTSVRKRDRGRWVWIMR